MFYAFNRDLDTGLQFVNNIIKANAYQDPNAINNQNINISNSTYNTAPKLHHNYDLSK